MDWASFTMEMFMSFRSSGASPSSYAPTFRTPSTSRKMTVSIDLAWAKPSEAASCEGSRAEPRFQLPLAGASTTPPS